MTREEVKNEILGAHKRYILAQLPTGYGKTRIALDWLGSFNQEQVKSVLIVIPRLVLINNWKEEFKKWGYESILDKVTFVTYVSLPKMVKEWDIVIFDEAHHLSQRCIEALEDFTIGNCILLSASISKNVKQRLEYAFPDLWTYKVSIKKAIDTGILPDPKVFLIPLTLDNTKIDHEIIKNKTQKSELVIPYSQRFNYTKIKNKKIIIKCTQKQYYEDIASMIIWYKRKSYSEIYKNRYLQKCGERLKWLSEQKSPFIKALLDQLDKERTLTFCNNISQTEEFGKGCVNSKNKDSIKNLEKFNQGVIDHITACSMLDEGMNLTNCRIGIFAMLNSSDKLIIQRTGRLLRHQNPIIIIPYFKHTREEEIMRKMLEDYNPDLVKTITNLTDLQL